MKQFLEVNKELNPDGAKALDLICYNAIDYQEKQRDSTKAVIGYNNAKSKMD